MDVIVLIAVIGYGQAADREHTRDAGFDRHLVKSVDYSNVEQVLINATKKFGE